LNETLWIRDKSWAATIVGIVHTKLVIRRAKRRILVGVYESTQQAHIVTTSESHSVNNIQTNITTDAPTY
jgi:hypothetical protein